MNARHLIVTGGTGYIGARLVDIALAEGRNVTLLGRRPGTLGTRHIQWALGDPLPETALDSTIAPREQSLVHLAHDWHADERRNVESTAALFAAARRAGMGARIFISSQSAREGALNRYGRMKWATEQRIVEDTSLRLGLVYGGRQTAMYGLLCRLTRLPILPMVDPHRLVQPIHLDEVAHGILAAADGYAGGVMGLAGPKPIAFGTVLRSLAQAYGGRTLPILPIPLKLALFACDISARLPRFPTIDRERILGLVGTEAIECAADLDRLGLDVHPMTERLGREAAGRRAKLAEGRAFLRHTLGHEPKSALIRRYAQAVTDSAISRPRFMLRWREPIGANTVLARRLRIAARIAEASAPGEAALANGSRLRRLTSLVVAVALEAMMIPSRMIATLAER